MRNDQYTVVKTIKLTKAQVLKALATEPLKATAWVETKGKSKKVCNVCAVGAVFHKAGLGPKAIDQCAQDLYLSGSDTATESDLDKAIDEGKYLSALSMKFETLARKLADVLGLTDTADLTKEQTKLLKPVLIKWVKDNFPTQLGKVQVVKTIDTWENKKVTTYRFAE